jgi:hypothetical protein
MMQGHNGPGPDEMGRAFGQMWDIVTAYRNSQMAAVAALYHFPEHLAEAPRTAQCIAEAESIDPDATSRLLRALVSLGLVASEDGVNFSRTLLLDTLRADTPGSMRGLALALSAPGHWLPWAQIADAVKTGDSPTEDVYGGSLWDYYAKHPQEGEWFAGAMAGMSNAVGSETARIIDTTGVSLAVDVGGASGSQMHALMGVNPELHGIVFDTPQGIKAAEEEVSRLGLADRLSTRGGDFLESVPEGDLYLLRFILHDWDDDSCIRILRNCRKAMRDGGRLIVVEMVIEEIGGPLIAPSQDMNMLIVADGGRERTVEEFSQLMRAAGLRLVKATPTNTPMTVIEAVASRSSGC